MKPERVFSLEKVDPRSYGLPPRTVLKRRGTDRVAIVMDRKSRIIMADGRKILDRAKTIWDADGSLTVDLVTSAPVCSKTTRFLEDNGIAVISMEAADTP